MTFRDTLLDQLRKRDKRERQWKEMINANQRLLHHAIELQKRNDQLILYESNNNSTHTQNAPANQQQINDLDRRIRELHEERAEMYKSQSENAQRLVHMNEQLRAKEETEKQQAEELSVETKVCKQLLTSIFRIKSFSEKINALSKECDLQAQQLREKNIVIQILQDELATLHLEIVTTEDRSKNLRKENDQLLQRWMNLKNEEAEKMNEATQFYEELRILARNNGQTLRQVNGKWVMEPSPSTTSSKNRTPAEDDLKRSSRILSNILLPSRVTKKFTMHEGEIYCVQASSTGSMFATGRVNQTLGGALQTITSVDFNSTDELVLGASTDNATRLWQLSTGRIKHTLTGHIGKVYSAKFNADSNRVVSGSHDRTLKVWDLQKGNCIRTIFTFSSCNDLCLGDADGLTLISGHMDNNIRVWDTRTGNGIKDMTGLHTSQITSVCMSPGGSTVLTNSRDHTLKIIDLRMYEVVQSFQADTFRNGINWSRACFSPDGHYVAAGSADGVLHIWNSRSGKLEKSIEGHGAAVCGLSWNPSGSLLYSADKSKVVCMWDTAHSDS
ncbi:autophagy protein 16 [Phycomyces blakesleeanus]|uniref:Autophagy protein 16 n=1 Tax=Phycomyces blakesleeanus TaxID=4837 RepID=A0ABR3BHH1_PHYBL